MGFKVRGYTREVTQDKVRDYRLFAIACEGTVTEPGYFRPFDGINRVKVDIIEPDAEETDGGSSPRKVLDRVAKYYYVKYLPLMPEAIKNARNADTNPENYMPEPLKTKVYLLAQALYDRIGKPRFEKFVAALPKMEQELLKNKK